MISLNARLLRLERSLSTRASGRSCPKCCGFGRVRLFVDGRPDDAPERQGCEVCGRANARSVRISDPPPGVDWTDVP